MYTAGQKSTKVLTTNTSYLNTSHSTANVVQYAPKQEQPKTWVLDDFKGLVKIGGGKFGSVYKAVERYSQKPVAIKQLKKEMLEKYNFFGQMKKELEIQWRLRHPNIVRLFGYFYDETSIYVVLELAAYNNLYQYLKTQGPLSEQQTQHVIRQVVSSLRYMHVRNVIHRDIKPENILIFSKKQFTEPYLPRTIPEQPRHHKAHSEVLHKDSFFKKKSASSHHNEKIHIKLCDFGWSTHTIDERRMTFCGTTDYVAPELVKNSPYDDKIDAWAVGILTYELLTGRAPFTGDNENDTYQKIANLNFKQDSDYRRLSPVVKDFIERILLEPKDRMSIADMLQHPWLAEDEEPVADEQRIDLSSQVCKEAEFTMLARDDGSFDD